MKWDGWVWGVDCQVAHLAVAFVHADTGRFSTRSMVFDHDVVFTIARKLELTHQQVGIRASAWEDEYPCVAIGVELPIGRFPSPNLMMSAGAIASALSQEGRPVEFLSPSAWKKALGIGGNASKLIVAEWAKDQGLPDSDEHECDALGLAYARLLGLGSSPRLTPERSKSHGT